MKKYELFPTCQVFVSIQDIVRNVNDKYLTSFAVGRLYEYDCGNYQKWEAIIFPEDINMINEMQFELSRDGFLIVKNIDIFEKYQIQIEECCDKNYKSIIVYPTCFTLEDIIKTIDLPKIKSIGWFNTDFGGHGSFIEDPFSVDINNDFIYKNVQGIGFLAQDVVNFKKYNDFSYIRTIKRLFLEQRILPFFKDVGVRIADGHYAGRPIRHGIDNINDIYPKTIEDLAMLGGLGKFIKKWLIKTAI